MTVSSVLIIIVAVFFVIKLFTANPVEGTWVSEEGDVTLVIDDSADMLVKDGDISARTAYTVDKRTKGPDYPCQRGRDQGAGRSIRRQCDRRTDSGSAGICRRNIRL